MSKSFSPSQKRDTKKRNYSLEGYCNSIKGMVQFKSLSADEFKEKAIKLYIKKFGLDELRKYLPDYDAPDLKTNNIGIWKTESEAKEAQKLYNAYAKHRDFTDVSDIEVLKNLVFIEIQMRRIQQDTTHKNHRAYIELSNQALNLKRILGLLGENEKNDVAQTIKALMNKAARWRAKNRLSWEMRCAHCGKMNLLRMKTEHYDSFRHPFFRDKVLANKPLWDLYKEGKISKIDISRVLFSDSKISNTMYCDWLENKIFSLEDKQKENQDSNKIIDTEKVIKE